MCFSHATMKALKWDRNVFFDVHQKTLHEVLRYGDGSLHRLQWGDFYMLMRGLTPVKVTVENRFRMAVKKILY